MAKVTLYAAGAAVWISASEWDEIGAAVGFIISKK
jgi:hypothetical protein